MTTQEFSDQFDVLYNNITSNQAPGLNEYEKSVFLTKAQEEIVKNYFTAKGNSHQDGFDDSPKRQADFATLISTVSCSTVNPISKFDQRSKCFLYPSDVFLILNEQIFSSDTPYVVVPISFADYDRLMAKPYKYPPKYQAWRLITGGPGSGLSGNTRSSTSIIEIIGRFKDTNSVTYRMRYIQRPYPIILTDLDDIQNGLSINGYDTEMTCSLPEHLHEEILQRAVELAKIAWAGEPAATVQAGQRSE